jgi:hypothetical protein
MNNNGEEVNSELDQIILYLIESLSKLKAWQSILGLHEWLVNIKKISTFNWIKGSAFEARGEFETAANTFKQELSNNNNTSNHLIFISNKIFDCYYQLNDWNEYLTWYETFSHTFEHLSGNDIIENRIDVSYIKSLSSFDGMLDKEVIINTTTFDNLNLDKNQQLQIIEQTQIFKTILNKRLLKNESAEMSFNSLEILNIDENSVYYQDAMMLLQMRLLASQKTAKFSFSNIPKVEATVHNYKLINDYKMLINNTDDNDGDDSKNNQFYLSMARLARKQNNFTMASKLLMNQLKRLNNNTTLLQSSIYSNIKMLTDKNSMNLLRRDLSFIFECQVEGAKYLFCNNLEEKLHLEVIVNSINDQLDYNQNNGNKSSDKCSASILKLVKWLNNVDSNSFNNLQKIFDLKRSTKHHFNLELKQNEDINDNKELLMGHLLDISTFISPTYAKSWYSFGNWCYEHGHRLSTTEHQNITSYHLPNQLELNKIMEIILKNASNDDTNFIVNIFSQRVQLLEAEENFNIENEKEFISSLDLLLKTNCSELINDEIIDSIKEVWLNLLKRVYYYHSMACKSYFTYLNLSIMVNKRR